MSNNLSVFDFKNHSVRVISNDPINPLFVAGDVAHALGYKVPEQAVRDRCKGQAKYFPLSTKGGEQQIRVIDEPNLYRLIFGSKLKSAEQFQDWVFEEVLPSIRKTGSYTLTISLEQQQAIKDLINRVANETGLPHQALYPRLHNKFNIPRYQELPTSRFNEAIDYLKAKLPQTQMFYGLRDGRYLVSVNSGRTHIKNIDGLSLVDSEFTHALCKNFKTLSKQLKILSGDANASVLNIPMMKLPEPLA